jgi:hypothetical protein
VSLQRGMRKAMQHMLKTAEANAAEIVQLGRQLDNLVRAAERVLAQAKREGPLALDVLAFKDAIDTAKAHLE